MYQLSQTLHKTKGNPFFSAGLKKTEGTSSLRLFSKSYASASHNISLTYDAIATYNARASLHNKSYINKANTLQSRAVAKTIRLKDKNTKILKD